MLKRPCCRSFSVLWRLHSRAKGRSTHIPLLKNHVKGPGIGRQSLDVDFNPNMQDELGNSGFDKKQEQPDSTESLLLHYLKVANSGFKRSEANVSRLQKQLTNTTEGDSKLQILFDYLLEECELEINRYQKMGPEQLKRIQQEKATQLQSKLLNDDGSVTEEELQDAIFSCMSPTDADSSKYFQNTDFLVYIMAQLNSENYPGGEKLLKIEQLVQAFELFKMVPLQEKKYSGLYLSATLLYNTPKLRMDPVNESFYIDTLVRFGRFKRAFELYNSYSHRVNKRWWDELGMMVLLRANVLNRFDHLLADVDSKWFEGSYLSPKVLTLAVRKWLLTGNFKKANILTERLIQMVHDFGIADDDAPISNTLVMFQDSETANQYLDTKEKLSIHDYIRVTRNHFFKGNKDMAFKLVANFFQLSNISDFKKQEFIKSLKFHLLRDIGDLKRHVGKYIDAARHLSAVSSFEASLDHVIQEFNIHKSPYTVLLFEDVDTLVKNADVRKSLEHLICADEARSLQCSEETLSKAFKRMLKLLCDQGNVDKAQALLEKMELYTASNNMSLQETTTKYCQVNAHHYAVFIDHILNSLPKKLTTKRRSKALADVSDILARMEHLGVPYNSIFLTSLLAFYRELYDVNSCFAIINSALNERAAEPKNGQASTVDHQNRITKRLYTAIWETYYAYFRVLCADDGHITQNSNHRAWSYYASSILKSTVIHPTILPRTLLYIMVHLDNLIPDQFLYKVIIRTFIKQKDWSALPAVITLCYDIHGMNFSNELISFILKGLEREYPTLDENLSPEELQAASSARLRLKKLLNKKTNDAINADTVIVEILRMLKFKQKSAGQFQDVREAYGEMNIGQEELGNYISKIE